MDAPSISDDELQEIYRFAIQLGKDAGQMLLDGLERRRTQGAEEQVEKMNAVDIVTQTDHGSSAIGISSILILSYIHTIQHMPNPLLPQQHPSPSPTPSN